MVASRQIERAAAAWLAQRDGGDWSDEAQSRLDAWLAASTAHRVAFLRLQAAWEQAGRLQALGAGASADEVPARGQWSASPFGMREPADEESVASVGTYGSASGGAPAANGLAFEARRHRRSWRALPYAGIAAVLLVAVSFAWGWREFNTVEHSSYRTEIGALRSIPLSDGSNATLGSDSRIETAWSRGERRIELAQGEAFFEVAKDAKRPFVVAVGERRVVAVGTRFGVRRDGPDLRVVVTEGTVRLESASAVGGHQPTTLLPAGNTALATSAGVLVKSGSVEDAEHYLDWRRGYLLFRDTPLAEAAAEFNRYNTRKIVMGDADVAKLRVGGSFRWSNVEVFVRLLEQGMAIRAEYYDDRIVLHSR